MDESLQELENELKRLRPRAPSQLLLARLEDDLGQPAVSSVSSTRPVATITPFPSWLGWRAASAAAAVIVFAAGLFVARPSRPTPEQTTTLAATTPGDPAAVPASVASTAPETFRPAATFAATQTSRYQPVGAASVLYDLREDGKVNLNDRTPARRLRYRYVDTYTWKNPSTNASLKWSVPRDEVRVLPASLH